MIRFTQRRRWALAAALTLACGAPGELDLGAGAGAATTGHFQMEKLDRGVVAVKVSSGVYVGWRMLGTEYDSSNPSSVSYNVYRNGSRIASVTDSTNYLDTAGTSGSSYTVSAVLGGAEQAQSAAATVWGENYLRIPLQPPSGGTIPSGTCSNAGEAYTYSANDGSVGDVDGDGQYEIILKWDPSDSKDNSQSGCTGDVYLDAYKLNGTRLWRIDLGPNIRAGQHYTQFVVYDFDGDGKAEMAVKTAPGTKDATGAYLKTGPAGSATHSAVYRNSDGYVLSGPEYLTVFAGDTGKELATVNYDPGRGTVSDWGDSYGNRVDRFLATAGFVSDAGGGSKAASGRPSIIMARGYYTRAVITAWNWRNGQLTEVWKADSDAGTAYAGQGAHTIAMADADGDGAQEIVYGASTIASNGTRQCSTGYGHGDAVHTGKLIPSRSGLQTFMVHEDKTMPSWDVRDTATCQIIQQGAVTGKDTGRGVADDIYPGSAGAELWGSTSATSGLLSAASGAQVGSTPASTNFLIWWDADESRELPDDVSITKYGGSTLLTCSSCASNNSTKAVPVLTADLLGDWREEVIWRESDSSGLRIYSTTDVTARRIYTLMHDPQYRMQVSSEQAAYNQPPHPSFHIGSGMVAPPKPDIALVGQTAAFTLTVNSSGSGSTNPAAGSYGYASGTQVTVTATPYSGYVFTGWSGAASGTSNPVTITVDVNKTLTANFAPATCTLTVISSGGGSTSPAVGTYSFTCGTQVTVTGTPASGYVFTGWSGAASGTGNPVSVTVDGNKTLTANFVQTYYTLTVNSTWGGSTSPAAGTYSYASGTQVMVTATPASGYVFTGWSGAASGTGNPVTITVDGDKALTANFGAAQDITLPSVPSNLSWGSDGLTVTLSWGAATDDTGVVGYDLYFGSFFLGTFQETSVAMIGFKPGVPYNFTVKARDAAGNVSAASNQATVLFSGEDTTPPSAPSNLKATNVTSNSVSLSWTASTDDVGVVVYQVYRDGVVAATVTSTKATITGLSMGTSYSFAVTGIDAPGNVSPKSTPLTVMTMSP